MFCMKYKIQYTTVSNGVSTTETVADRLTFEECQKALTDLFGYVPTQEIKDELFGTLQIQGFKLGRAYEIKPKCYYHIQKM